MKITKSIGFSYPTSSNAIALGFEGFGCWHISVTCHDIEGSGQSRTFTPHNAEGFDRPDNLDLIAMFLETDGKTCEAFKTYGNPKALEAIERHPQLKCRKCEAVNPMVYLAPVVIDGAGSCICLDCADARGWIDGNGNICEGVEL